MNIPEGPFCGSCGMPIAQDPAGGGTERDGSTTTAYCGHCYQGGAFTMPDLTVTQMQDRVRGKLREVGVPETLVTQLAAQIPALPRWRTAQ